MKLKTVVIDGVTYAAMVDGKPVYVHDDGKEVPFDGPAAAAKITSLNGEAKGHREAKEAAEAKLKAYEGIDDPAKAKAALETVANLDSGQLIQAGKVEEIKAAARKAADEQVANATKQLTEDLVKSNKRGDDLENELRGERIGGSFTRSKYITDKLSIPPDMAQSRFGQNFKIEEGKIIGYDGKGNKLYSRAKPGELADFDEAMELLVDQYPYRENIVKGTGGGGGARHGAGNGGGSKEMKRSEFVKLNPIDQQKTALSGTVIIDD